MKRTTIRLAGTRARQCALAVTMLLAIDQHAAFAMGGRTMTLDDGRGQLPIVHESVAVSIGEASGSGLALGEPGVSNLGAFNVTINAGPTLAGNAAAMAAFNRAAAQWDAYFADPILVTINADLAPLGPGILGSASSVVLFGPYSTVRNAIVADAANEADDVVATLLPTAANASFLVPDGFTLDGNMQLTKANAKALGFAGLDASFGASDGELTFSSQFNFDYDNSNGLAPGAFDFETVAAHEIGHILGFLSDLDYIDAVLAENMTAADVRPTPVDMFRFEDELPGGDPATLANFGVFPRSMTPGKNGVFDQITGGFGGAVEVLFATGDTQGDGDQASHWKDSLGLGIMDPTLAPGEISLIKQNDLRAFDLIGYEIVASVPEPGALGLMFIGAVAMAGWRPR